MSQFPLVVITGASSGFGAAMAMAFSQKGHPLLLLSRRLDPMKNLDLPRTMCASVDVNDYQSFSRALEAAENEYGPADLLINNAGVMLLGQVDSQDPSEWKRMFDVNVLGLLNGMKLVLKGMKERNSGTIINVSSVAGRKTFPSHAAYCGTKFAVHAITENVREEVSSHNVRVITIAPGAAETELLSHTSSEEIKAGYENWKEEMGGVMAPEDVTRAALYAYEQPQSVTVREIVLASTRQAP